MSATPSSAGAGWSGAIAPPVAESREDAGRNALQALLAFACLRQQAERQRGLGAKSGPWTSLPKTSHEEFAFDEVLQLVAARAVSITGADGVAIALANENAIVCRASAGDIAPDPGVKLDPNSGFSGACLRSGESVRCDDSETDERVNAQACRALGTRSMVAVPLAAKQRVIGLIEAFSKDAYGFNDSDVRSLNLLGELILSAIRPPEEDRLAELSRRIITPELPAPSIVAKAEPVLPKPTRIIVDEKFAPAAATALPESKPEIVPQPAPALRTLEEVAEIIPAAILPAEETSGRVSGAIDTLKRRVGLGPQELEAPGQRPALRSISGTAVIAAAVVVAIALGWAVWQKIRHAEQAISANTPPPTVEIKTGEVDSRDILAPAAPAAPVAKPGPTPQITGIRHWASADSSTVVIDLEDQVQYEAHTLSNPDRIYFDLHDTKIAPGLLNQSIEVNDAFLKRIRMAQPTEGITRLVLETKGAAEFSVSLEPNPYRFTIEVHKPGNVMVVKPGPSTLAKPSPAISGTPDKRSAGLAPSSEFRIVLDAGHGGWDLGTVGKKGLLEKDLVLDIVQRLGKLVEEKLRAQVIYTRQDDSYLPLEKRAEIANLSKASMFLSVHANYSDLATARGVETYYTNTYSSIKARTDGDDPQLKQVDWTEVDIRAKVTDSHRFAADVQQALYGGLASRNPDVRNRGVKEAQYVVLTGTQMPAVLAEVSFVSSPADEDKLQNSDYRQQIAEALYRGIAKFRDDTKHTSLVSARRN